MPVLRTDDGPRKLRAVWLGPKGATLPFEWTYVQWSVTLLMIPVGVCLVWALLAVLGVVTVGHVPWFAFWFGVIYGGPAAVYLAVRVMRNVSFDEPLRYKFATARDELGGGSRQPAETEISWVMPWPRLRDLDTGATDRWEQLARTVTAATAETATAETATAETATAETATAETATHETAAGEAP